MVQFCYFRLYLGIEIFFVDCCYGDGTDAEEVENIGHFFFSCFHAMPARINQTKIWLARPHEMFYIFFTTLLEYLHCVDTNN